MFMKIRLSRITDRGFAVEIFRDEDDETPIADGQSYESSEPQNASFERAGRRAIEELRELADRAERELITMGVLKAPLK